MELTFYPLMNFVITSIIKDGISISGAIQVCVSLEDKNTKQRELNGLINALEKYNLSTGLIITKNNEEKIISGKNTILIKPLWKFLMGI